MASDLATTAMPQRLGATLRPSEKHASFEIGRSIDKSIIYEDCEKIEY
jgi:hypothetical protein